MYQFASRAGLGFVPAFIMKHIATCDFPGESEASTLSLDPPMT